MEQQVGPRPSRLSGIVTLIGGALMIAGVFLPFVRASAPGVAAQTAGGLDTPDGKLFLGVGIALLVIGLLFLFVASAVVRRILAVLVVLAAGFMTYAAILDITGMEQAYAEQLVAQNPGATLEQAQQFIEQSGIEITPGFGLYLILAGAIIGVAGGLLGVFARGRRATDEMAEPAPMGPPAGLPSEHTGITGADVGPPMTADMPPPGGEDVPPPGTGDMPPPGGEDVPPPPPSRT